MEQGEAALFRRKGVERVAERGGGLDAAYDRGLQDRAGDVGAQAVFIFPDRHVVALQQVFVGLRAEFAGQILKVLVGCHAGRHGDVAHGDADALRFVIQGRIGDEAGEDLLIQPEQLRLFHAQLLAELFRQGVDLRAQRAGIGGHLDLLIADRSDGGDRAAEIGDAKAAQSGDQHGHEHPDQHRGLNAVGFLFGDLFVG